MSEGINGNEFDFSGHAPGASSRSGSVFPTDGGCSVDGFDNTVNQQQSEESIFFTPENLAQTGGDGAFREMPRVLAQEFAEVFSQYGVEEGYYDLLDDETGLVKGSREDFETAAAIEKLNATLNEGYQPRLIECPPAGRNLAPYYLYDSDGNGTYETEIMISNNSNNDEWVHQTINEDNSEHNYAVSWKNGELNRIYKEHETRRDDTIYYSTEDSTLFTASHNIGEGPTINSYHLEYNPDGSLKSMKNKYELK